MESALDKVLRLAGPVGTGRAPVQVRQYQRTTQQGRVQVVRQHVQQHASGAHRALAGELKQGNVIQVGNGQYVVSSVKPYTRKPSSGTKSGPNTKGTSTGVNTSKASTGGLNTAGGGATGSAGQGVAASADPQAILDAAAKAAKIAFNAPEVELGLKQAVTGKSYGVLVARTLPILVVR